MNVHARRIIDIHIYDRKTPNTYLVQDATYYIIETTIKGMKQRVREFIGTLCSTETPSYIES